MITDILGYLAGFLATIVMIPQLYKTIRLKINIPFNLDNVHYYNNLYMIVLVATGIDVICILNMILIPCFTLV